jgi:hypothetical protein
MYTVYTYKCMALANLEYVPILELSLLKMSSTGRCKTIHGCRAGQNLTFTTISLKMHLLKIPQTST